MASTRLHARALHLPILLASTLLLPFGSAAASAQGQPDRDFDIVVTAQKRSERLADVPISISAVSAEQLQTRNITALTELERLVPGFTAQPSTSGIPVFSIRGIGFYDLSVGAPPTVAVYVDEVPLPYTVMASQAFLDVERVEVAKGPQGVAFGQNTTGGAINIITAKPTPDWRTSFDITGARFDTLTTTLAIGGPISGNLGVRLAVQHQRADGWQYSETRPDDRLGRKEITSARLLIKGTAADNIDFWINANGWINRSELQAAQFLGLRPQIPLSMGGYPEVFAALGSRPPAPRNPRAADWDPGHDFRSDDYQYQLASRIDLQAAQNVKLSLLGSYVRYKTDAPIDFDGTDFNNSRRRTLANVKNLFGEMRLDAQTGFADLLAGLNYQEDRISEADDFDILGSNTGAGPIRFNHLKNIANQRVRSYAAFATAHKPLTDRLSLDLGIRYTRQTRRFAGCLSDPLYAAVTSMIFPPSLGAPPLADPDNCATLDATTFQRGGLIRQHLNESNFSWRAGLNWKPSTSKLVYGNVTRGYKAGTFTPLPALLSSQLQPVSQEKVTTYELGYKYNNGLNFSLEAAAFYYDYVDKQLLGATTFPIFGPLPALVNVPSTSVRGAEMQLTYAPTERLKLSGGITYVASRVDNSFRSLDPFGQVVDIKGNRFPNTPRWQGTADIDYAIPAGAGHLIDIGIGGNFRSASNAGFGNNPVFRLNGYVLIDARLGYRPRSGNWRVELWGGNIFNRFYVTNTSYQFDVYSRTAGMPATYGMTFRMRMNP